MSAGPAAAGDSTTARDFGAALRELRHRQKPPYGVSYYARLVNRPLGRVFAAAGFRLGMSPNHMSLVSAACTFGAIALIATVRATPAIAVAIAALAVLGFALDSADGQVARLSGRGSVAGEWLDHILDCVKMVAIHGAVLIAFFRFFELPAAWLLAPLGYQLVAVCLFFGSILTEQLKVRMPAGAPVRTGRPSPLRAVALLPGDYGVFCVSLVLLAHPPTFLVAYTVLGVLNLGLLLSMLVKWYRELTREAR